MTRFEVTATVPNIGKVKHVIRAADTMEAKAKVKRAHRNAARIEVQRIKEQSPGFDTKRKFILTEGRGKALQARQQAYEQNLIRTLEAIPPEGAGTTAIAKLVGAGEVSARKWCAELERRGQVTREAGKRGYLIVRRVEA